MTTNPITRLAELEQRVAVLEQRLLSTGNGSPKAARKKDRTYSYPRRFTDAAKALLLQAFDEIHFMKSGGEDPAVCLTELQDYVHTLPGGDVVPSLPGCADSVRAMLAERAGLNVVWSTQEVHSEKTRREQGGDK